MKRKHFPPLRSRRKRTGATRLPGNPGVSVHSWRSVLYDGAAGSIGTDYAAKQPPDGYSFMIANLGPIAVNPLLSNVPYNVEKDFAPVSLISTGPNVLVVRSDAQFRSLGEIIAHARANPGK